MAPHYKTEEEIAIMREGGQKLARIKEEVARKIAPGMSAMDIEILVDTLIKESGAEASFKKVKGYSWATCVNVNDGVVHGIPKKSVVFRTGDVVSVDLGVYFKGFHTDTSISFLLGEDKKRQKFLATGKNALENAIAKAQVGLKIRDISSAMEETLKKAGFSAVRSLVGHGIGRKLHEYPPVPCFVSGSEEESLVLETGLVIAIEAMYTAGSPTLVTEADGWTISTSDGKIAGLFEETVAVTANGPQVLTR